MKYIILLCTCCLFLNSCSDSDGRLILVNKTNKTIGFIDEKKERNDSIPSLSLCDQTKLYTVSPNNELMIISFSDWDVYFKHFPTNLLRVYIINNDTLSKYGTCEVIKQQMFIKRFDYTYDELKNINWRIVFDGK